MGIFKKLMKKNPILGKKSRRNPTVNPVPPVSPPSVARGEAQSPGSLKSMLTGGNQPADKIDKMSRAEYDPEQNLDRKLTNGARGRYFTP